MFTKTFAESSSATVTINDVSAKTLGLVLRFLYTDGLHADAEPQDLLDVLAVGNMWQLPRLVNLHVIFYLCQASVFSGSGFLLMLTARSARSILLASADLSLSQPTDVNVSWFHF